MLTKMDISNLEKTLSKCQDDLTRLKLTIDLAKAYNKNNILKSIANYKSAIEIANKIRDNSSLLFCYEQLGTIYLYHANYPLSLENFFQALIISFQIKDNREISEFLNSIGTIYNRLKDSKKALHFFMESKKYDRNNRRPYTNIGLLNSTLGNYKIALEYLNKAFKMASESNDVKGKGVVLTNIAEIYSDQKNYNKAMDLYNEAVANLEKINDYYSVVAPYLGIASLSIKTGDIDTCFVYLAKAEKNSVSYQLKQYLLEAYRLYAKAYGSKEMYKEAYQYSQKYLLLNEQIYTGSLNRDITQIQSNFMLEREKAEQGYQINVQIEKGLSAKDIPQDIYQFAEIIGFGKIGVFSQKMKEILDLAIKYHQDRSISVLIEGETGTGKEIIARLIHYGHKTVTAPFISINCSAITPSLFESELFGYEGGAYTGSRQKGMPGKVELAQGGTLFLDEIGDLPIDLQPKLLRFLQEKEMYRIGGIKKIKLDVRVVCATNQNIPLLIKENKFRKDLFYRLNPGHIYLPPLRQRPEEVKELALMFLDKYSQQKNKKFKTISKKAIAFLESKEWEGNIRELENLIERVVVLYDDTEVKPEYLQQDNFYQDNECEDEGDGLFIKMNDEVMPLTDIETKIIEYVLDKFEGNKSQAAKYLKIDRTTLRKRMPSI